MDIEVGTICVATLRLSTSMVFAKLPAALTTGGGMGLWWILPGIGIFLIALLGLSIALWRTGAYRVAVHKYRKMGNRWPVTTLSPGMAVKGVRAGKSLDGDPLTQVRAHLRRARLRVQQTLWRLQSRDRWDRSVPRDIVSALDAAINEIRECSEPTKLTALALLQTAASKVEAALEQRVSQALHIGPGPVEAELFEVARACRIAQFIATVARNNPLFLQKARSLASFTGKRRIEVNFEGALSHMYPHHCVVAGVQVILPVDDALRVGLSPGIDVRVEGVLGPKATVFSARLQISQSDR